MAKIFRYIYGVRFKWRWSQWHYGEILANAIFFVVLSNHIAYFYLQRAFLSHAKPADWDYDSGEFSDQSVKDLILNSVRARLLDFLDQEIPYNLLCEMEYLETEDGNLVYQL